jgi:hypothetical protein
MLVLYHSPVLGILAILASYTLVQVPTSKSISTKPSDYGEIAPIVGPSHFDDTLEVYTVNHMTPLSIQKNLPMLATKENPVGASL